MRHVVHHHVTQTWIAHGHRLSDDNPPIGLHWITINNIALYELEKYAPDNHAVLHYHQLYESQDVLQKTLRAITKKIQLHMLYNLKKK